MAQLQQQMELFEEGGLKDEGNTIDPVSGNEVPPGSTQEEVRDDIPAQLSEGEFVFPADVVRYIGLETLMRLRQEAKEGLKQMEAMGQMGNAEEATIPDDIPFDETDLEISEEGEEEVDNRAKGGIIKAATGFSGTTTTTPALNQQQSAGKTTTGLKTTYQAPVIPAATTPTGFRYGTGSQGDATQKATYKGLFGDGDKVTGPDEYKTFINDQGQEIQVPFKAGKVMTGFTVPEGYKAKDTQKVDTGKVQTARTKTARVEEESGDDGGMESALGGARTTVNGVEYAVQYNFDGTVGLQSIDNYKRTGEVNFRTADKGLASAIKTQTLGQIAQLGKAVGLKGAALAEFAKSKGINIPGYAKVEELIKGAKDQTKNLKNWDNNIFEVTDADKDQIFDTSMTKREMERMQEAIAKGKGVDRSKMASLAADLPDTPETEDERMKQMQKRFEESSPSPSVSGPAPDMTTEKGRASTYASPSSFDDTGFEDTGKEYGASAGAYGGIGDYNTGGLANKKKPKVKKMKKGGLASKK